MDKVYKNITNYYTDKIKEHGPTPQGVDWNGSESQFLRFEQLSKIFKHDVFSVSDVGCGYGKYLDYLKLINNKAEYTGYDLSIEMIKSAKEIYSYDRFFHINKISDIILADYSLASGIFSVKMEHTESEWLAYILSTIEEMDRKSRAGFSFNMLTKYSDAQHMKDNLYYADPLFIFDYCKRNFSGQVALLHDYGLYEFTILVRKVL